VILPVRCGRGEDTAACVALLLERLGEGLLSVRTDDAFRHGPLAGA